MKILLSILILSCSIFAGTTTFSGRVIDSYGTGVYGATLRGRPVFHGECSDYVEASVRSNPFGYFTLPVPDDCSFFVDVTHKQYTVFDPPAIIVEIEAPPNGPFEDAEFIAIS